MSDLVWQGRVHLGDEPGQYGDAVYCGLAFAVPITLYRTVHEDTPVVATFVLEAEDVDVRRGYPGHLIAITEFVPGSSKSGKWKERPFGDEARLTDHDHCVKRISVQIPPGENRLFVSLGIKVDTSAAAGMYDDFIVRRIRFQTPGEEFYARLGFDYRDDN